ncbi:MAG: xanthine dehydrogenase family protein molybdopterin-binding subunit [Rubrobacteraceae bacterium]|uniref:xanthine dehydrogenase family protein molybdopterin-binding subunit n=1 Tax=Rubrobacter naiadicus TaxID=1392641 RepID=UPI00235DD6ED|nr:molybdopterin cofactor-binding domain-containing protein [Rubrobacter naiadicus]MBX6762741.1 molybdopterin-dependent oxidoreductase [Rubrobacteraceae bacterium]MCL6438468.1 xanthine dehydrogenase family protein molybdopterin-binding subunit [Rubrobacteraceae bacterium]
MTQAPEKYVGGGVLRKEDPALVTGRGTYVDNMRLPGMLHAAVLRSPYAHAKIKSIDTSAAKEQPGVVAVFTGEELAGEWASPLPCGWQVTEDLRIPDHWPLAKDEVNYVGDAVAVVVAVDRYRARDAVDMIEVDYEPLDVVTDMEEALKDGSPVVHEDLGTNECYTWPLEVGDVEGAFEKADVVVKERYIQQRLIPNAIETRGVVAQPDPVTGGFTVYSSTQVPHLLKITLSAVSGVPENKLRIVAPDVGGGFGSKLNIYAEEALALALARKLNTPIKWVEDRSENYLATIHGRDQIQDIEVAATSDGKILGMRVKILADMGAYLQLGTTVVPLLGAFMYPGVYNFDAYSFTCTAVFTNKTPTDAYRGAGRPEAAYACERIIDALARRLNMDPVEVRRKNFYEPFDEPTTTPAGIQYDSMNMQGALDKLLEISNYEELREEQRRRREQNDPVQLGLGFSTYTEICGIAPSQVVASLGGGGGGWEAASVRVLASGKVEVVTGTSPHGQGHVTSWSQIAADVLGVSPDDVEVIHGDTASAPWGRDTYGSRSLPVGGVAVYLAAQKVVEKAKKIAAHMLEAAEGDIEFEGGRFSVVGSPDKSVSMQEVAGRAYLGVGLPEGMEPGLSEEQFFDPPNFTFPFGAHLCVSEVDTETGKVRIRDYFAVDDCGPIINPQIVEGQLHGGIAQGIAQALYEEAVYDEDGNLVTGSMVDYLVPAAPELPNYTLERTVTPSPSNALGVKGVGEAGTIGSPQAVINSIIDALAPFGVTHIDMPASPWKVWQAIQEARGGEAGDREANLSGRPAQTDQGGEA